jgi:hypothetical protein
VKADQANCLHLAVEKKKKILVHISKWDVTLRLDFRRSKIMLIIPQQFLFLAANVKMLVSDIRPRFFIFPVPFFFDVEL